MAQKLFEAEKIDVVIVSGNYIYYFTFTEDGLILITEHHIEV